MVKTALVTGSTSGIGLAIAKSLLTAGYEVVLNSKSSTAKGEQLSNELGCKYVKADVSQDEDVYLLKEQFQTWYSKLDLLVNNAGFTVLIDHKNLEQANRQVWRDIFETNVFGTFAITSAFRNLLSQSDTPQIINISSIAGLRPTGSSIPYSCSKAALNHMTKLLAKALGPKIRVNAIAPGLISTPWTESWDIVKEMVSSQAPLKRPGEPEDIANAVTSILSNTYLTGEILTVDGGWNLTT